MVSLKDCFVGRMSFFLIPVITVLTIVFWIYLKIIFMMQGAVPIYFVLEREPLIIPAPPRYICYLWGAQWSSDELWTLARWGASPLRWQETPNQYLQSCSPTLGTWGTMEPGHQYNHWCLRPVHGDLRLRVLKPLRLLSMSNSYILSSMIATMTFRDPHHDFQWFFTGTCSDPHRYVEWSPWPPPVLSVIPIVTFSDNTFIAIL